MSTAELAHRVGADESAVRGMLDVWANKGKVVKMAPACNGCTSCDIAGAEHYRWDDEYVAAGCAVGDGGVGVR